MGALVSKVRAFNLTRSLDCNGISSQRRTRAGATVLLLGRTQFHRCHHHDLPLLDGLPVFADDRAILREGKETSEAWTCILRILFADGVVHK